MRALALFVALLMATIGIPTVITQAAASAASRVTPADNPDLAASCGLDVVLVLDASSSISSAGATADVKSAANTFLTAFKDTNTRIGIVKFNTNTLSPVLPLTTVTTASTNSGGVHESAVASYSPAGRTNWQDALLSAKNVFTSASPARNVPKLVVFVTDGAPNTVNSGNGTANYTEASAEAVDPAVTQMNAMKALGIHSLVVGAGDAFKDTSSSNARIDALYRVSQFPTPKIYPTTAFDAATTDLILQKDFSALGETLRNVANQICDGILTVTKYASSADAPNTYVKQGAGWDFTTTVNPSGDWLKPTSGSGAARTAGTDANGTTLFQWNASSSNWTKSATVTDTGKANYTPDHVVCTVNNGNPTNPSLSGSDFTVAVGAGKQVACDVYNKFTGPPNTDVGVFKSVSAGQVTVGDTVTWTIKAQNFGPNAATNVKITDTVPSGLGAVTDVTTSAGSYNSGTGVWSIPNLAVGAGNAQTLTFKTKVTTPGDHLNKVKLSSMTEKDTNPDNNNAEVNVVGALSDVTVAKTPNVASQVVNGNVVWTITATNDGVADAKNVKVLDTLGADLTYVSDDGSGAYDNASKTWTIGNLDAGQSKTLKITTKGTAAGVKSNKVVISTTTPESNPNNNEATATVKFTISDVSVTKTADKHDVLLGNTVVWTITVANQGDAPAKNVVVTDALPAGLTLVSTDPTNALVGNTWTVGDLAPGATKVLKLTTKVTSLTPVLNKACATTDTPQSTTTNDCGQDTVTATAADVTVTKVPSLSEVYINGTVVWTVKVLNSGSAAAENVVVTDLAPTGLNLTTGTATQGSYANGTWNVGTVLGGGGNATLTLNSTVGTTLGLLTNKVDVTTTTPESDDTNNHGEGTTNVTAADVTIAKVADKESVYVGDTVVWTITASNNGPATANDVVVTDVIPAGLQVTAMAPVDALTGNAWNVGTLISGESKVLKITTKAIAVGEITNVATIATSTPETNTKNNWAQDTICVTSAEISVTKKADNTHPVLGGQVVWTVTVTNSGTADAQNVVVEDVLPAGLQLVSTDPANALKNNIWTVGTLPKGASKVLKITTTTTQTGTILNEACATSDTPDMNWKDNCGHDTVWVTAPKVSITKVADKDDAVLQDTVVWTVKATNSGNADAFGVVVTDTVPAGLTVTSSVASKGSYDTNTGVWTIGTLAKQSNETLTLTSKVTKVGSVTNTACIDTTSQEVSSEDKTCDSDTVKVHAPDVNITKSADDKTPGYQGTVVWTITASNTGDAAALNVVAQDTIPTGLTVDSANVPVGTTFDAATGVWTIGTLNAGQTKVLKLTTTVANLGPLTNTVCITTDTSMTVPGLRCDDETVTVTAPKLTITKVADTEGALLGDTVHWVVSVTNTGDRNADNVIVTDNVPTRLDVTAANPSQGTYNLASDVWTVGTITPGATKTLDLTSTVKATGALTNKACVTTTTMQVDNTKKCGEDTVTVTAADVTVEKSAAHPAYVLGDQVVWTVKATNLGSANALNTLVKDTVPANMTVTNAVGSAGTSYDTATDVWTIGTLAKGGGFATLTLTTTPSTTGSFTNHVHVSTTTPETNYNNNDCDATVVVKAPNLVVTKSADIHQQYLGGEVVWTITVNNNGNADAKSVVVTDVIPAGLELVSTDPANALENNAWNVGDLAAGQNKVLKLTTRTTQTGDLTNQACVTTSSPMTEDGARCDDDTVTVTRDVKLSISKTQSASTPNPIQVGANVKYDITMTNSGKSPANDVHFTDTLPAGLEYVSATGTSWTCVNVAQSVDCTYGIDLAAGATTPPVVVTAKVLPVLLQHAPVDNVACVTPSEGDRNAELVGKAAATDENEGQCDTATTEFPKGSLTLAKSNTPDGTTPLGFGDTITYKLKVTATGDLDQHGVVITDDIPGFGTNAGSSPTTYVAGSAACVEPPAATPANCGIVPTSTSGKITKLTWNLGDLAHGQTREVTFKVTIDVAPSNSEGNSDTVTVTNAGAVQSIEIPNTPSNPVENPVKVVSTVGDTDGSCVDEAPYLNFTSNGWFANQVLTLHLLNKDGKQVETRQVKADANGHLVGHELWPGYSKDSATGVTTYPGLDVRPLKFFLSGPPQTTTVTVAYPPVASKCDAALSITKANEPTGTVEVGDTISYTLSVKIPANGSFNQDNVVVTDYIPGYDPTTPSATTTYVADSAKCVGDLLPNTGTCNVSLTKNSAGKVTKVTWGLGSMKPGQNLDLVFKVTADEQPNADSDTVTIYNAAAVESAYWPSTPSNQVTNALNLVAVEGVKTPGGVLAATGSDLFRELGLALSLLVVGAFLLRGARRKDEELGEH